MVSYVIDGLEHIEEGFEIILEGRHFGKVAVKIRDTSVAWQYKL